MADLPTATIVCIAVGLYLALVIGLVILCYFCKGRGRCQDKSECCAKKEGEQSCECCIAMAEACNCCKGPSLNSCLDSCCPNRKQISCVDIIMCQCCASEGTTFCDCCRKCKRDDPDTCNCLCLEIRLRSVGEKETRKDKMPVSATATHPAKQAWAPTPNPFFHTIPMSPEPGHPHGFRLLEEGKDLHLDLGWFGNAANPISTHPINTNRSEASGDFVPTSTPRFHQGRSQLFIRPGVFSAGRVIAKRQPEMPRRWSSRRRSSRRSRSPSSHLQQRRKSSRVTTGVRSVTRRHSQRERVLPLEHEQE